MIRKVIDTENGRVEVEIFDEENTDQIRITREEHPGVINEIKVALIEFNGLLQEYGYKLVRE